MCNSLRNGSRVYKIPEWGFGYKVFVEDEHHNGVLRSHVMNEGYPKGRWIRWDESYEEDGFCFLTTIKHLKKYKKVFWGGMVYRIRYRRGLGRRKEFYRSGDSCMSSLCKEFKILKEVDIKDLK